MEPNGERWSSLKGGYGVPYDPRGAIRRVAAGDDTAWSELWQELHHQGDVGEASYAAVPELVRTHGKRRASHWNLFALAVTIEEARDNPNNPQMPNWLKSEYDQAWRDLERIAIAELAAAAGHELVDSLIATVALAKGRRTLARMAMLTEDEREEM